MDPLHIVCVVVIFLAIQRTCRAAGDRSTHESYYNHNGRLNMVRKNWMNSVSDETQLTQLSMPGTHDTMSLYGGPIFQTQSMTLYSQLRAGIRALDIRCRHIGDRFEIHHGPVFQRANFDQVLTTLTNFLGSYPSEVILMRMKEEHVPQNNTRTFGETFFYYIDQAKYRHYFWRGNGSSVKLQAVRGKIVLLRDFPCKKSIGIPWANIDRQDDYIVPTLFWIGSKWTKVRDFLERSKNSQCSKLITNFLSGTSPGAYPFSIARRINRYTMEWLIRNQVDNIGLIFMDFPGEGLIRSIIDLNVGLRVSNLFDAPTVLSFVCSPDESPKEGNSIESEVEIHRIHLKVNTTYRYKRKQFGKNVCKFWADNRSTSLTLQSGNENIIVNEVGIFRERDGFADRQELKKW